MSDLAHLTVTQLMQNFAKEQDFVFQLIRQDYPMVLKTLLQEFKQRTGTTLYDANFNVKDPMTESIVHGMSLLQAAVACGNVGVVEVLLGDCTVINTTTRAELGKAFYTLATEHITQDGGEEKKKVLWRLLLQFQHLWFTGALTLKQQFDELKVIPATRSTPQITRDWAVWRFEDMVGVKPSLLFRYAQTHCNAELLAVLKDHMERYEQMLPVLMHRQVCVVPSQIVVSSDGLIFALEDDVATKLSPTLQAVLNGFKNTEGAAELAKLLQGGTK